jgi:hypothetical protein
MVGSSQRMMLQQIQKKQRLPLYNYTKVKVLKTTGGRTYFEVLEGEHKGKTLSMGDENARQYLGDTAPVESLAKINVAYGKYEKDWVSPVKGKLSQQWATLTTPTGAKARVAMNSVWGREYTPLPPGTYSILVPDAPHDGNMTTYYRSLESTLQYDQVWFPIEYGDNSRYLHIGHLSDGCVTVTDFKQWMGIHEYLLSHRSKDRKYVGTLSVTGKPERER